MDENGRPAQDERRRPIKTYKIQGHKSLPYDAQVIVRCTAPGKGLVTKAKSLHLMIPDGGLELPDFDLTTFLFDKMRLGANMGDRGYTAEKLAATLPVPEAQQRLTAACEGNVDMARDLWSRNVDKLGIEDNLVPADLFDALLEYAADKVKAEDPPVPVDQVKAKMLAELNGNKEAATRIWKDAQPPEGEAVPFLLAQQMIAEARKVGTAAKAETVAPAANDAGDDAADDAPPDGAEDAPVSEADVQDPPAPHPADEPTTDGDQPSDEQRLEAFLALVKQAEDTKNDGVLARLRSRVGQLPDSVRKKGSEGVTAAQKRVAAATQEKESAA
jgi:hypothetical protein